MESNLNSPESAYSCVSLDLNVEDSLFDEVVIVGKAEAGDRDYFEIGVRYILKENTFKKDDSVDKSE